MVEVKKYVLPPTRLIPNNPNPLIHYPNLFSDSTALNPAEIYERFNSNGWQTQWIFRYGATQESHYHSSAHECMVVLSGSATIRFGVGDTVSDLIESTHGAGKEEGGIEIPAHAGDVFIIPAGVAHKTFDTAPSAEFKLLTPGNGHLIDANDARKALAEIELSGFTMIGAYPVDSVWDFATGTADGIDCEKVWAIEKPGRDPVLGDAQEGLGGLWK